jgi:hypothetical protein
MFKASKLAIALMCSFALATAAKSFAQAPSAEGAGSFEETSRSMGLSDTALSHLRNKSTLARLASRVFPVTWPPLEMPVHKTARTAQGRQSSASAPRSVNTSK